MKGMHVVALGMAVAATAVGATVAVGQGTGGTVGPKAVGTRVLEVRLKERDIGLHCPERQTARQCQRDPRLGSVVGGTGAVYEDGRRVGTAHFTNITTKRGRNGGALFLATVLLADGTLTLQGAALAAGEAPPPSSITGGSGAYAGARGVETEENAPGGSQTELRVRVTLTFIP